MPKNKIKLGKTAIKNLDLFLTYSLDQFLTYKRPNLGPIFNSTAYIYIYIYMHAVKLLSGPSLGFFNVTNWAKLRGANWAKVIFGLYLEYFQASFCSIIILCCFCVQLSANFLKIAFSKKRCNSFSKILCFKFNFGKLSFVGLLNTIK